MAFFPTKNAFFQATDIFSPEPNPNQTETETRLKPLLEAHGLYLTVHALENLEAWWGKQHTRLALGDPTDKKNPGRMGRVVAIDH